ncbi:TRAP transporter solute receptor, DctP family protein, partial [Vibrio parahaemolyticus 970107]
RAASRVGDSSATSVEKV